MMAHAMEKDSILPAFLQTKLLFRDTLPLSMHCSPEWAWQATKCPLKPILLPCPRA